MARLSLKLIAFLLIGLVIGGGIGYTLATTVFKPPTVVGHPLNGANILIGVIHADTGYVRGEGTAATIAKEEIEQYAKSLGINLKITLLFENAEGSATKAVEKFQSLVARGVKFVLGWRYSSHVKAALPYANQYKVLLISDASTSPALSIPDRGYLFRLPTDDNQQGKAIARMIIDYGVYHVAVLQRADTWADGLFDVFEKRFKELGGEVFQRIRYDPEKTEFSAEAKLLDDAIKDAISKYGKDKVGFLILSFGECVAIQAAASTYGNLMSVPWFGSDGHVLSEELIREQGNNALKVKHICTYMGIAESEVYWKFAEKYKAQMGYYPETYDTLLYDSLWLLMKTIIDTASTDPTVIKEALPKVAEKYFGASGWCALNEFGDRRAAYYNIWAVVENGTYPTPGELGWARVGVYDPIADKVTWFIPLKGG